MEAINGDGWEHAADAPLHAVLFVLLQLPSYQPIPFDEPVITLQDGQFCPTSQPEWSAYRDPSFGHGKSAPLAA